VLESEEGGELDRRGCEAEDQQDDEWNHGRKKTGHFQGGITMCVRNYTIGQCESKGIEMGVPLWRAAERNYNV